ACPPRPTLVPYTTLFRSWTGQPWEKTRAVVGRSFRMRGPEQSVYTMAATAVMRLIERYEVDPRRIGFLGLGTESSTDNSARAVRSEEHTSELQSRENLVC